MKYTLEDLRFYEELTSIDSDVEHKERKEQLAERFGTDDIHMEDLLEGLDIDKYTYIHGGSFDSPGYDMNSYVVAWLEDGKIKLECFVEESY